MKKIRFISPETDAFKNHENKLIQSCRINNIDINIIGKNIKWDGFITKYKLTIDYLKSVKEEIICYTDSRDVLYMSDEKTIYDTFIKNFDKNAIVFNAETNCYPEKLLAPLHPQQDKKYKYLNSGCIIGSRKTMIEVFEEAVKLFEISDYNDDQYLVQRLFITGQYNIQLDYDCKIFQCLWDENFGRSNNFDIIYTKDEIYNRLTKTTPLIFHFPGPTTTDSQVWKILNNKYYNINKNNYW